MEAVSACHRFLWSRMFVEIWPDTLNRSLESFFVVRETRYLSETSGSNKLAELDLYLRHSRLRSPVLEVLGSDEFRLALADEVARKSENAPVETLPDLTAGALAQRDIGEAIRLIERQRAGGPPASTTSSCSCIFTALMAAWIRRRSSPRPMPLRFRETGLWIGSGASWRRISDSALRPNESAMSILRAAIELC